MEIFYHYDGSFDGFLSCVFESYAHKEIPAGFYPGEDGICSLFDSRTVPTDPDHAARVLRKVAALSPEAAVLLRRGFLTCLPEKELHLFRLTAKLLREGPGFLRDRSDGTLFPVIRAVQHLNGEVHLLKGFVRFSDLGGVLGGEIEPKNRVLPVLGGHFAARFHNERFFLYDRTTWNIREVFEKGRIKVHAEFDGIPYDGSIVNMGLKDSHGNVCYVIGVLKSIRERLGKKDGDMLHVVIEERQ